jgi:hypothetical protein
MHYFAPLKKPAKLNIAGYHGVACILRKLT